MHITDSSPHLPTPPFLPTQTRFPFISHLPQLHMKYILSTFFVACPFPLPPLNYNTLHPLHWDLNTRKNSRIWISNIVHDHILTNTLRTLFPFPTFQTPHILYIMLFYLQSVNPFISISSPIFTFYPRARALLSFHTTHSSIFNTFIRFSSLSHPPSVPMIPPCPHHNTLHPVHWDLKPLKFSNWNFQYRI